MGAWSEVDLNKSMSNSDGRYCAYYTNEIGVYAIMNEWEGRALCFGLFVLV